MSKVVRKNINETPLQWTSTPIVQKDPSNALMKCPSLREKLAVVFILTKRSVLGVLPTTSAPRTLSIRASWRGTAAYKRSTRCGVQYLGACSLASIIMVSTTHLHKGIIWTTHCFTPQHIQHICASRPRMSVGFYYSFMYFQQVYTWTPLFLCILFNAKLFWDHRGRCIRYVSDEQFFFAINTNVHSLVGGNNWAFEFLQWREVRVKLCRGVNTRCF